MPRYIDFAPQRPRSAVSARPAVSKKVEKPSQKIILNPASKSTPKPVVKTVKKTTVTVATNATPRRRPVAPRGLRIDFARPTSRPAVHKPPVTHPIPRPAVTPHRAPAPTPVKPAKSGPRSIKISGVSPRASKPAQKVISKPTPRPISKPAPKPTPEPEDFDEFAGFDDVEPMMSDDDLTLALAGFADDDSTPVLTDNLSKEVNDFNEELDALDELDILADDLEDQLSDHLEAEAKEFVEEPKPLFDSVPKKRPIIPLGDRSRFLTSVSVEKRPLSSTASATSVATGATKSTPIKPTKSTKFTKSIKPIKSTRPAKSAPTKHSAPVISTPEPKSHSFAMTLAIVLTVILGAGLGAVVYLAFFQE